MPTTEARRARRLVRIALVGGAVGLFITATVNTVSATIETRALVDLRREHDRIDRLEELRADILVARAEHRAFLLDQDERSRQQYLSAEQRAFSRVDSLGAPPFDDATFQQAIAVLRVWLDSSAYAQRQSANARVDGLESARSVFADSASSRYQSRVDAALADLQSRGSLRVSTVRAFWDRTAVVQDWAGWCTLLVLGVGITSLLITLRRESEQTALSEARYAAITDESPDGIIVQVNGVVRYANRAAHVLFRAPHGSSLIGRTFFDLVHASDRAEAMERARRTIEGNERPAPRVLRFLRDDGSDFAGEVRGIRVTFEKAPAGQVVIRNFEEREETQRALEVSEQRYRALLEDMAEGVLVLDTSLGAQIWNPAAERILGLTSEQLVGRNSRDPIWQISDEHDIPLPVQQRYAATALRTGQRAAGVMGFDRPDGRRAWLYVSASPLRREGVAEPYAVELTFTDITAERESASKIAESEARYRLLADNSADLVSRRSLDHRFEYVSPSHEAILGWTSDEMLGKRARDFIHPHDVERLSSRQAETSDGLVATTTTLRVQHKDGHYLWLEGMAKPIVDESGTPTGYQVAARDITARHTLEEQLRQSQKLEAMGRMAGGVAHDFNNLLTVMRASAQMLDDSTLDDGDRPELLHEIQSAIERATALTAQLLAFSRKGHGAPEHIRVASLLQNVSPLLSRLCGDRVIIDVEVESAAKHALIDAEVVQVEQVLFNLVVNARDAMFDGGRVTVRCGIRRLEAPLAHAYGTIAAGAYVTIEVQDTGDGMSDEVQAHVFEPFFTTKPQGKGTGLGLSTVFGIVNQANGAVLIRSEIGRGCTVTVFWPMLNHAMATPTSVPEVNA